MIGAIIGAVAPAIIGGLMNDGGGGGSAPAPAPAPAPGPSPGQSILGGLFSGLGMAGIGPLSTKGLDRAAEAADPFATQRPQYTNPLFNMMQGLEGQAGKGPISFEQATSGSAPFAMSPGISPGLRSSAGGASMSPALLAMMNGQDPSTEFRFQTGIDSMNRSLAQTGQLGSGAQMIEAEKYGQQFASQEFQNQFARQLQLQQAGQGVQQQNFGQQLSVDQLGTNQWAQQFSNLMSGATFGLSSQGQGISQELQLGSLLANLAGAGTSNPSQAGAILAGKYGQSQDNIANFINSIGGMGILGQGIGKMFSGGPSSAIPSIGPIPGDSGGPFTFPDGTGLGADTFPSQPDPSLTGSLDGSNTGGGFNFPSNINFGGGGDSLFNMGGFGDNATGRFNFGSFGGF